MESTLFIEIVTATRMSKDDFWSKSALGQSLKRLVYDPETYHLNAHVAYENKSPLPVIFNSRISAQNKYEILIFIHDDVWIDDYFLADRVIEGLNTYDVIGVAGNRRKIQNQANWSSMWVDEKFIWDDKRFLSGSVAHGPSPFGTVNYYGRSPSECEQMDGVFLAAKKSTLIANEIKFDPRFDFHFYDMDFCRSAREKGLRLGTWPICLTHQSVGNFSKQRWREIYALYHKKWEE